MHYQRLGFDTPLQRIKEKIDISNIMHQSFISCKRNYWNYRTAKEQLHAGMIIGLDNKQNAAKQPSYSTAFRLMLAERLIDSSYVVIENL